MYIPRSRHSFLFKIFEIIGIYLGMAIYTRPADTRPGPTLIGRILPGPINYRVGYGFKKKKPETSPGQVQVFAKTWPEPEPEPEPEPVYI